jgi:hypothetical protein
MTQDLCRAEFEKKFGGGRICNWTGAYHFQSQQDRWEGWQAAWNASQSVTDDALCNQPNETLSFCGINVVRSGEMQEDSIMLVDVYNPLNSIVLKPPTEHKPADNSQNEEYEACHNKN